MKRNMVLLIAVLSLAFGVGTAHVTYAEGGESEGNDGTTSHKERDDNSQENEDSDEQGEDESTDDNVKSGTERDRLREMRREKSEERVRMLESREERQDKPRDLKRIKLGERAKKKCEAKETRVNELMGMVRNRSDVRYERMSRIFELVQTFYEKQNLTVADYDELAAKVTAAKAAAEAKKEVLGETPKFSCDSDGPKADIQEFLAIRKSKIEAFQAYRTALHELVKAVLDAARGEDDGQAGAKTKEES